MTSHVIPEDPPEGSSGRRGSWIVSALKAARKPENKSDSGWTRINTYRNKSSASSTASAIRRGKHGSGWDAKSGPIQDNQELFGVWVRENPNNTKKEI